MKRLFILINIISIAFPINAQTHYQLRDSIIKYENIDPNKAIEFGVAYTGIIQNVEIDSLIVGTYAKIGGILSSMGLDASALTYFNNALKLYESMPDKNKRFPNASQPPWILLDIGNIYLRNGEYERAEEKYNESIKIFKKIGDSQNAFYGLNTSISNLGLIEQSKRNYIKAESFYLQVYKRRKAKNKVEDILYSLSQLISISLLQGNIQSANNYFEEAKLTFENINGDKDILVKRNFGYGLVVFGSYYQSIKEFEKAITYLNQSKDYLNELPVELAAIGSRFAECYLGLGDLERSEQIALDNLKIKDLNEKEKKYNYKVLEKIYKRKERPNELLMIKDSLLLITAGGIERKIFTTLNNLETQIQLAKSAKEINDSKIKYNTYLYILIICTVILFFSLMTIRINYNLQKEKTNRLELESELIKNELDKKNRELISKSNFIIQRNDYLKRIQKQIESQNDDNNSKARINKELEILISSEKSYQDFDKMFVEVYPEFYSSLNKMAKLSKTDLRLASYIKMNHTNDEIARISGISIRTVESQRYRLSKKLNLNKDQSLNSFLHSI